MLTVVSYRACTDPTLHASPTPAGELCPENRNHEGRMLWKTLECSETAVSAQHE